MPRTAGTWSTQQLAEFVAAMSDAPTEDVALRQAIERAAEAVDADVAAVVRGGSVAASVGWPEDGVPIGELVAAVANQRGEVTVPGRGVVRCLISKLGEEHDASLLLARAAEPSFDAVETGLVGGMAQTLALSLRTLRSVAGMRERQRLLEGLSEIQRAISRRAPLNDVLEMVVELTHELVGDELSALFLRDPDDPGMLVLEACRGIDDNTLEAVRRRRVGEGVAGRAVADDRLIVVEDYETRPGMVQYFSESRLQGAMGAPVHENGEVVGSLLVGSWREGRRYGPEESALLQSIAQHVSLALTDAKTVGAMVHQALHDALTGLPNRALFLDRLEHAQARALRTGTGVAVLFLDLDRFKTVNDSLGHAAGDELLCAVSKRLADCMRASDTAARLGGDEFAVLLEDMRATREAVRVAERVIAALSEPIVVAGREVYVSVSVGVATGAHAPSELLRHADVAMYRAKAQGKGRYAMFEAGMQAAVMDRLELEADLQRAVDRGQLELYYQPIIALATGELVGHEALARWRHPTRGLLPPDDFIPMAEETGLIVPIGRFVMLEACRQAAAWEALTDTPLTMNVNLSGRQLEDPGFLAEASVILGETGVVPGRIVLEITETVLMQDTATTIERLRALRALGVRLAVDDFGTGYSSLRYLDQFPLDVLKMAKPFVDGLGSPGQDPSLARAIIDLAANLGLTLVAEGIESSAQLSQLRRLGCPMGQGFWFGPPIPGEEVTDRLAGRAPALL